MIIHEPQIMTSGDKVTTWAAIEYDSQKPGLPEFLWYRFPMEYKELISEQTDAFLLPSLMLAIHLGEDVQVRGVVSPRLAYNLGEYLDVLSVWSPDHVRPIEIVYQTIAPIEAKPTATGSCFSGGLDSIFTIWANMPERQPIPGYQITHALYIKGIDLIHAWDDIYELRFHHFESGLTDLGVVLIKAETNANRSIVGRFPQTPFSSPPLLGCMHALGKLFSRVYVPSSGDHRYYMIHPSPGNPLLDRLLSSDGLEVIQHGSDNMRVEKVEAIVDWPFAHQNLKVCFNLHEKKVFNCSRCEKCTRTLLPIYVLGKSGNFRTFKQPFKRDRDLFRWARYLDPWYAEPQYMELFVRKHRRDLLPLFYLVCLLGMLRYWVVRLTPGVVRRFLQRWGYFQPLWLDDADYELPEVVDEIQNFSKGMI